MPPRFGGAPKCPRCEKSVYMAEQVIGPGGAWHNYCLTCKECNKRLDSTTLTEKDNQAYCKTCYTRKWGPKGYGFAGGAAFLSTDSKMPSEVIKENELNTPSNHHNTPSNQYTNPPLPARQESPALPSRPSIPTLPPRQESPALPSRPGIPPRPVVTQQQQQQKEDHHSDDENENSRQIMSSFRPKPQTTSGYINNHSNYVPRKFNFQAQNDICTGCGKAAYAAELVLGAGNKYHKLCLKCCQCGKRLDSTNMVDRDFDLYCRGCYSKAFGPKGYGYGNLLTPEGATR